MRKYREGVSKEVLSIFYEEQLFRNYELFKEFFQILIIKVKKIIGFGCWYFYFED